MRFCIIISIFIMAVRFGKILIINQMRNKNKVKHPFRHNKTNKKAPLGAKWRQLRRSIILIENKYQINPVE